MNRHLDDEILAAYVRDLLTNDEQTAVLSHLDQCSRCQKRLLLVEDETILWQHHFSAELKRQRPSSQASFSTLNLQKKWSISMHKLADYLAPVAIILLLVVGGYALWPANRDSVETAVFTKPAPPSSANPLEEAIQNLTYTPFGGGEPITLVGGQVGDVLLESYTFGDLNGDGLDDVAFIVNKRTENGSLPEAGAALNMGNNTLTHVGNEFLFPDVEATLSIVGLQVVVEIETADNAFPATMTYIVANGRFVQPEMLAAEAIEDAQYQQYFTSEWDAGQQAPPDSILTRETLSNMVYQVEYTQDGNASLSIGLYREPPRTSVRLLPNHAYGDVAGNSVAEAIVVIGTNTGGSGFFMDLIVVTVVDGQPQQLASIYLGDGVQIDRLAVAEGIIQVEYDGLSHRFTVADGGVLQPIGNE